MKIFKICTLTYSRYPLWHSLYHKNLIKSNKTEISLQLMRWIISGVSALWKVQNQTDHDSHQNNCSLKPKQSRDQRDTKDSKMDKGKKESEIFTDELSSWKPWFHIWPKESNRFNAAPTYNAGGKYCVKIFWMVSHFFH